MIYKWQIILAAMAGWINRQQRDVIDYLQTENVILREQLDKQLEGKRLVFTNNQRRRLAIKGKVLGRKLLKEFAGVFTPDTILRWHTQLIANKYDGSRKRKVGRPSVSEEIIQLILRMARENITWGYKRIQGGLKSLGFKVSRSTVRRVLKEYGIDPAPERGRGMKWSEFLKMHWGIICAAVFFTPARSDR